MSILSETKTKVFVFVQMKFIYTYVAALLRSMKTQRAVSTPCPKTPHRLDNLRPRPVLLVVATMRGQSVTRDSHERTKRGRTLPYGTYHPALQHTSPRLTLRIIMLYGTPLSSLLSMTQL